MRTRILRMLVVGMLLASCGVLNAAPVLAFDARTGDTVSVAPGEEVDGDLYLAGRSVSCGTNVDGDVFAGGQTVSIAGQIDGGLTAAGQTVLITADVSRGIRVAGSSVDLAGVAARDLIAAGNTVTISNDSTIEGDLAVGGNTVSVQGDVAGNVWGSCQQFILDGSVGGNVKLQVGTLTISPGATIAGNLDYTSATQANIPAGTVKGTVTFTERAEKDKPGDAGEGWEALGPLAIFAGFTWKLLAYLMALLTGIVLILILPARMTAYSDAIRTETGPVAGWGALALFVTPLAAIVACITIVGLPLGLITLTLWAILLYLSQLPVALVIGHVILGRNKPLEGRGFMIGSLALGLLIIMLLCLIPFVGWLIGLATALFGFGAVVVAERRRWGGRR
ncbi:MAG: polymer-forming cytoskeletal protein [Dehalococcoidia bacterium]|nr:polymer-forming cytoskeletal protein [Dehalococcoidia bacterium]